MTKWIGRPILLAVAVVASVLGTTAVASASGSTPTTTSVVETTTSPVVGQPVTYTVTVAGASGGADPTGTVTFTDLPNSSGGCTTSALTLTSPSATAGQSTATCTTTYSKAETGTFTASYGGDAIYAGSTGAVSPNPVIAKGSTATALAVTSPAGTPVTGQLVTYTATVSPISGSAGTPTGTVTFTETAGAGSPAACGTVALVGTSATCTVVVGLTTVLPSLQAAYSGDGNFVTSTSAIVSVAAVNPASTREVISSPANPSVSGQALTFTATVQAIGPGTGTPAGTVTFSSSPDGVSCASVTLVAGSAKCSLAAGSLTPTSAPSGMVVTVAFTPAGSGPTYSSSSGTLTQSVVKASTSLTLLVSPKKPSLGGPVTLSAVVVAGLPSSGTPTGTVQFNVLGKSTGPLLCDAPLTNNTGPLTNSVVTCNLSSIPDGSTPLKVTVTYFGDNNYLGGSTKVKKIKLH